MKVPVISLNSYMTALLIDIRSRHKMILFTGALDIQEKLDEFVEKYKVKI